MLRRILQTVVDSFGVEDLGDGAIVAEAREAQGPFVRTPQRRTPAASEKAREDRALLRRYHEEGDTTAREELIERHLPLVRSLARRYAGRGEALEDIEQVGAIGLIKAIDRFELEREVSLATYATPNVVGEISATSATRAGRSASRALQELNASMSGAIERPHGCLGRSPSIAEIGEEPKITEEVLEAMEVGPAYSTVSLLDRPPWRRGVADLLETIAARTPSSSAPRTAPPRSRRSTGFRRASARSADAIRGGPPADPDRAAGRPFSDARLAPDPEVAHDHAQELLR